MVTPLLGIKSLIAGDTNEVIYADTAGEMATKVIDLLKSDDKRHKLEQAGIIYVKNVHDQQKIGEQLEAALQSIVKSKRTAVKTTS